MRKYSLSLFCAVALAMAPVTASAQPAGQQQAQSPDELRLILMIRNAIVALNQANITGNYSVLRELGTPTFQQTNNPAKLAEAFATLRNRKIDISPVMFFPPRLTAQPNMLEGQVLRLTGFFATAPEHVNFDIAFQITGDQWMLAAIAVNVAPPGEGQQASTMNEAPPQRAAESKPIRIDLTQPAGGAAPQQPQKKASPSPKKPKPDQAAAPQQPARPTPQQQAGPSLSSSVPAPSAPAPAPAEQTQVEVAPVPAPAPAPNTAWNPFGR
ncbi:hypothetical protein Rvan_0484 [Rhodomicrobium vannielii ATCC 17100]|uniref:DUF4440 domain-containing protein n=2 Tax=Rhodomicrobium vannielii TaxID=1069 RepID=E3HYM5_RHOVT|nr:hypothetical protein Rvan_0484 [Rhodomicrobium vannielii ATCC 17100]